MRCSNLISGFLVKLKQKKDSNALTLSITFVYSCVCFALKQMFHYMQSCGQKKEKKASSL